MMQKIILIKQLKICKKLNENFNFKKKDIKNFIKILKKDCIKLFNKIK